MYLRAGDGTHPKKRRSAVRPWQIRRDIRRNCENAYKGETPIEKNVIVVDEQGVEYEATYRKRAKGLVKSGRARFVNENRICLACPPNNNLEDKTMENSYKGNDVRIMEMDGEFQESAQLSLDSILSRVDKIIKDSEYLKTAIESISGLINTDSSPEIDGPTRREIAESISQTVRYREETNQQILRMFEKMLGELNPAGDKDIRKFQAIAESLKSFPEFGDSIAEILSDCAIKIFSR